MFKKTKISLYSLILKFILTCVFITCRWKVINIGPFNEAINNDKPILLCLWHNQLACVSRYFKNTRLNLYGVSSSHFDSEILAKILVAWKIKLIRGSSSWGWSKVLKKMIWLFRDSSTIIALTNDGPKGPPKIAKEGSLSVAKKYNAQILCVSADADNKWVLKTWDKTIVPKPFLTIYIKFSSIYNDKDDINSKTITQFINSNSVDLSS